jgi:hypothetical protein
MAWNASSGSTGWLVLSICILLNGGVEVAESLYLLGQLQFKGVKVTSLKPSIPVNYC